MSDVNSEIYIQLILAVRNPDFLIEESWEEELKNHISNILSETGNRILAISVLPDHVHIFFDMNPDVSMDDLVTEVKRSSTGWINQKKLSHHQFRWQGGYGAFSYSRNETESMVAYINNQKNHHELISFKDEFINLLQENEIEYKEEDLFDWIKPDGQHG